MNNSNVTNININVTTAVDIEKTLYRTLAQVSKSNRNLYLFIFSIPGSFHNEYLHCDRVSYGSVYLSQRSERVQGWKNVKFYGHRML